MAEWRAVEIHADTERKLVAIASVDCLSDKGKSHFHLYAAIEPRLILVCTRDGISALDLESNIRELDELRQDIPALDDLIRPFQADNWS